MIRCSPPSFDVFALFIFRFFHCTTIWARCYRAMYKNMYTVQTLNALFIYSFFHRDLVSRAFVFVSHSFCVCSPCRAFHSRLVCRHLFCFWLIIFSCAAERIYIQEMLVIKCCHPGNVSCLFSLFCLMFFCVLSLILCRFAEVKAVFSYRNSVSYTDRYSSETSLDETTTVSMALWSISFIVYSV